MGNRAVLTTCMYEPKNSTTTSIYLHWNGGRDSVEAFLTYCKLKGYRPPETDCYGWARLCQVIGNFFGGGMSIGIDACCNLDCDNGDNGTYTIKNWEIVRRHYFKHHFEQRNHDLTEMLIAIDKAQPASEQFGEDFFRAAEISIEDVKLGDMVYLFNEIECKYEKLEVVGFGELPYVNGVPALNKPYVKRYGDEESGYAWNCNNYIRTDTVRVVKNTVQD